MKYSICGIEEVSYTNKQGNEVNGIRLHLINESLKRDNLKGQAVEQIFISMRSDAYVNARKLTLNSYCEPVYNRYGSVEDIFEVE